MKRKDKGNIKTDCSFRGENRMGYEKEKNLRFSPIILKDIYCN